MSIKGFKEWLDQAADLVENEAVWKQLTEEWDWPEAYDTGLLPEEAVVLALVDVMAPTLGENMKLTRRNTLELR